MSLTKERRENAARLYKRLAELNPALDWVADVDELQRISRALGRIGERQCNEDTGCRYCDSTGTLENAAGEPVPCDQCAGTGDTLGKRERNLLAKASKIAAQFGLRIYHQSDPRGWQVYLIPTTFPQSEDDSHYNTRGFGVAS